MTLTAIRWEAGNSTELLTAAPSWVINPGGEGTCHGDETFTGTVLQTATADPARYLLRTWPRSRLIGGLFSNTLAGFLTLRPAGRFFIISSTL
jgi:hypothetical protein